MKYYIDGYNLLFRINNLSDDLEIDRNLLIEKLDSIFDNSNIEVIIVFDAHRTDNDLFSRSYFKNFEVIFTSKNQLADDYILEEIFLSKNPSDIKVITTDKTLKRKAKEMTAKVENFDQFFDYVSKKLESDKQDIDHFETPSDIKRLIKIFEERLKNSDDYD